MIRKAFKVGDTITIKRTSHAGTGYRYALVRLTGGVALVEELSEDADTLGGMSTQSFYRLFSGKFGVTPTDFQVGVQRVSNKEITE